MVFLKSRNFIRLKKNFTTRSLLLLLLKILELHDTYTGGHSEEVAKLSQKIAEHMGLPEKDVEKTCCAGIVHDIGKILIPKNIKNGSLTEEEYDLVKKHPLWGYQALKHSTRLKNIAQIILHHHEWWNGKGYPHGLRENEIPLISRIIAVADSWNAMRSKRPYRAPLSEEKALTEIKNNKEFSSARKL